jgi:hypothetical protein
MERNIDLQEIKPKDIRLQTEEFSEASIPREVTVKTEEGVEHFINTGSKIGKKIRNYNK